MFNSFLIGNSLADISRPNIALLKCPYSIPREHSRDKGTRNWINKPVISIHFVPSAQTSISTKTVK
jgi:hypothetical protein